MEQAAETAHRSNETWLADLGADGTRQGAALSELREYIRRGLFVFLRESRSDMARRDSDDVRQLSEDFAQEALLKILRSLSTFRGESRFATWAMKIAIRTAISSLRRAAFKDLSLDELQARGAAVEPTADAAVGPTALPDPQMEAERNELFSVLQEGVESVLSERQRTAFLATNVDGVPIEVVAKLMDSNVNALYKMVHDARKKLRAFLIDCGFTFERVAPLFESG
jgi:RNA polymerase sigma-70 factor (ECF subfamily)